MSWQTRFRNRLVTTFARIKYAELGVRIMCNVSCHELRDGGMLWSWHKMKGENNKNRVEVAISNVLCSGRIVSVNAIFCIVGFSSRG